MHRVSQSRKDTHNFPAHAQQPRNRQHLHSDSSDNEKAEFGSSPNSRAAIYSHSFTPLFDMSDTKPHPPPAGLNVDALDEPEPAHTHVAQYAGDEADNDAEEQVAEDPEEAKNGLTGRCQPVRNLMNQFESLSMPQIKPTADASFHLKLASADVNSKQSPHGVDGLLLDKALPTFHLHPSLQLDLPQPVVNRVSFYGVVFDVNKEATSMSTHDKKKPPIDAQDYGPLLAAISGERTLPPTTDQTSALIDEEKWLLLIINSRSPSERSFRTCPATFAEAIGEVEPMSAVLSNCRTQLWKPSRSWWEAKSGKNPWIEPISHNKRWRYLWPLIHYHKFLARCIKKLKRNNIDLKTNLSPVSVFLREEVCAVSDHLANASKFTSEEWENALQYFYGWTSSEREEEEILRSVVSRLELRGMREGTDIDSPLLKSQIDESFLRAMAAARENMITGGAEGNIGGKENQQLELSQKFGENNFGATTQGAGNDNASYRNHDLLQSAQALKQQPLQLHQRKANAHRPPRSHHTDAGDDPDMVTWVHPSVSLGEKMTTSTPGYGVYPFQYHATPAPGYEAFTSGQYYPAPPQYPHYNPQPEWNYYQHMHHPNLNSGYYDQLQASSNHAYTHTLERSNARWSNLSQPQADVQALSTFGGNYHVPVTPSTPENTRAPAAAAARRQFADAALPQEENAPAFTSYTPCKEEQDCSVPPSPFWGHLDPLAGLATPGTTKDSSTPNRRWDEEIVVGDHYGRSRTSNRSTGRRKKGSKNNGGAKNSKPVLINSSAQYYHRQFGTCEGYGPPSPATQFLMSPQANSQAAAYFANGQKQPFSSSFLKSHRRKQTCCTEEEIEEERTRPHELSNEISGSEDDSHTIISAETIMPSAMRKAAGASLSTKDTEPSQP